MDARIRGSLPVRFAGVLAAALMLAPHLAGDADAQVVDQPQALSVTILGRGVTLRWQPPTSVSPGFTGYVIEAGASPGATSLSFPVGNVLTYFVIAPNGRYYVRVRAVFGTTPGAVASNEVEVVVPPIPTAPANVRATVERLTVNLTWNYGFGSAAVTEWQLHAGSAPGLSDLAIVTLSSSRQLLTATVAAGTYYVRVIAINESGASAPSQEVVVTTGPNICDLPGTPTGFRAVAGQGGALLYWDGWSGYLPTGYLLTAGQSPGAADFGITLPRITNFGSFAPPSTYYARIAAYNSCGQSAFTPDIAFTVAPRGGSSLIGTWSGTVSNYSQPFPWTPITSFQLTLNANPTPQGGRLPGLWIDNKGCRSNLIVGGISILPYISMESLACNDGDFVLTITSITPNAVEGRCNAGPNCSFRMTR